ncbi:MAG: hypothetical protein JWM47_802 [Acidimicrobiales bacterium]|nr:hypothetical protein [Acidimicrobiales bacterium]
MSTAPRPAHRLLVAGTLVLLLAAGAAGCSTTDDDAEPGSDIGEPATLDSTSTSTSTTTTGAPVATTAPPAPHGAATPADASAALYAAFVAGDRAAAARVAEPPAIEAVFGAVPGPYQPYRGCDTGEFDTSGCLYRDRSTNHTIQFDLERRGEAWVVTTAFYSPD